MSETVNGYCRTCKTEKPETAFPTISPLRANGFEGARDWDECRACKAARREARKSPDYIHPDVQALIDAASAAGIETTVEVGTHSVFVAFKHFTGEVKTALDLYNSQDTMYVTFRRLSGGVMAGTRYGYRRSEKVRTARDVSRAISTWAI